MKISIEKIIKEIPENLTPREELRYLYLKLGNIFSYNRDFLNSKDYRQIKRIYNDFITISMIEKGIYQNKIIATCKQFAEATSDTINESNQYKRRIKARTVGYVEDEESHVEVIATIDGKNYCLSIDKDLYKIQKGMKTKGFATDKKAIDGTECGTMTEEELKKIDEKLGYCKNGIYTDDIIQLLKKEMAEEQNWEQFNQGKPKESAFQYKIDFIFRYLKNNAAKQDEMNIYEVDKYYKKLYGSLLTEEEKQKNKLRSIDIKTIQDGKLIKSVLYEIQREKRNLYYIYSQQEKTFIETTKEEILEWIKKGILEYETESELNFEEEIGG